MLCLNLPSAAQGQLRTTDVVEPSCIYLCLSVCLSVFLSLSVSLCPSLSLSACLSVSLCPSLSVPLTLFFYLCLCLSLSLSLFLFSLAVSPPPPSLFILCCRQKSSRFIDETVARRRDRPIPAVTIALLQRRTALLQRPFNPGNRTFTMTVHPKQRRYYSDHST